MAKIKQTILAKGKWGRNYTVGRGGKKVGFIVIHYTATLASALNNLRYFASKYVGASAHYFIDPDGKLYQSVLEKDTAWAVGAKTYKHKTARNSNTINIEVVANNRKFTDAQIATLDALVAKLRKKYGVPQSNVLRHYGVTGKKCPAWYIAPISRWNALKTSIANAYAKLVTPAKPAPKPAPKPKAKSKVAYYKKYTGKSPSIVAALNAIKVGSSFANRKKIAAANGIKNYKGTASQNIQMLALLKTGKLKKY